MTGMSTTDPGTGSGTDLKSRLQSDLTASMRARDEVRSATLRMALTAVRAAEVAGSSARTLSDDEVEGVLGREAKKRREAVTAYTEAGRPDRAERETAELAVLEAYLPQQLSDEELSGIVADAVSEASAAGAAGPAARGRVMKIVQPRVARRAEGSRVAAEVRRQLSS
jgi:uncharacterized protein YqeY